MRGNLFTKVALGLIALFLALIAIRPFIAPRPALGNPEAKFGHLQWLAPGGTMFVFDQTDGSLWYYRLPGELPLPTHRPVYIAKLTRVGAALQPGRK